MEIQKIGINSIIPENEKQYYALLEAAITSVDEWANVIINKGPTSISIRISPSLPVLYPLILKEMTQLHNILNIKLNLSKSIRKTSNIHFFIDF